MTGREMRALDNPGFIRTVIMFNKIRAFGHQAGSVIKDTGAGTFYKLPLIAIGYVQLPRKRRGQFYRLFAVASAAQFCLIQKYQRQPTGNAKVSMLILRLDG